MLIHRLYEHEQFIYLVELRGKLNEKFRSATTVDKACGFNYFVIHKIMIHDIVIHDFVI